MSSDAPPAAADYVGLVTRAIAFVVDAVVINLVAVVVGGATALTASVFHFPKGLQHVLVVVGGIVYVLWTISYFVSFWSATGQTPGARVMQIRVVTSDRRKMGPKRGVIRVIAMVLAALPLFAGYALIAFDRRCRGLQDRLAGTLVIEAPQQSLVAQRRDRQRVAPAPKTGAGELRTEQTRVTREQHGLRS